MSKGYNIHWRPPKQSNWDNTVTHPQINLHCNRAESCSGHDLTHDWRICEIPWNGFLLLILISSNLVHMMFPVKASARMTLLDWTIFLSKVRSGS